ncbi:hypothetical protein Syun_001483 [Stephania yunnanensis]|uniref:Uncharacterized protein n=1 Tax=Stephania yunnanensis TaxID=152371 RepID=A0AAP0Q753_9MAGN
MIIVSVKNSSSILFRKSVLIRFIAENARSVDVVDTCRVKIRRINLSTKL